MKEYKANLPEITLKYKKGTSQKYKIASSLDCAEVLRKMYDADTLEINESVIVLFLNKQNTTIGWTKHSSGGSVSCIIDVKLILVTALQCGAQSIILSHNHPSGNLTASQADINMSRKLKIACEAIELVMLDSIIITEDGYTSLADDNQL